MEKYSPNSTLRTEEVLDVENKQGKFKQGIKGQFSTLIEDIEGVVQRIKISDYDDLNKSDYSSFNSRDRVYESNFTYISVNCGCCCSGFSSEKGNKNAGVLILVAAAVFAVFYDVIGLAVNKKNLETMSRLNGPLVTKMNNTVNESKKWNITPEMDEKIQGFQMRVNQILREAKLAVIVSNGLKLATIAGSVCVIIGGLLAVNAVLAIGVLAATTLILYRIYDWQAHDKITDAYCNKLNELAVEIEEFSNATYLLN